MHKQLDVLDKIIQLAKASPGLDNMDWRIERNKLISARPMAAVKKKVAGAPACRWNCQSGRAGRQIALTPARVIVRFQTDSADTAKPLKTINCACENLQRAGLSL